MHVRTPLRFLAPVLLAAALVAGCSESGGDDDTATTTTEAKTSTTKASGDPTEAVQTAVNDTIDQSTMTFELDAEVEGAGQQQAIAYDGKVDHEADAAEATFEADGRGALTARVFETDTYVTTDLDEWSDALNGKTWLQVAPGEVDGVGTLVDLDTGGNVLYRLLNATDVEAEGTDDADGGEVQTYAFTLEPEVSDEVPDERREGVEALLQATGSGVLSIEGTVGIGTDDGLVHVVHLDGGVRAPGDDESDDPRFTITYDGTFSGFGEAIELKPPADADTVTLDDAPAARALIRRIQTG